MICSNLLIDDVEKIDQLKINVVRFLKKVEFCVILFWKLFVIGEILQER